MPYIDYAAKRYIVSEALMADVRAKIGSAEPGGSVELQITDEIGVVEYLIWSPGVPLIFGDLHEDRQSPSPQD